MQNCIFCKIISKEIPATYIRESDYLIVLQDRAPQAPIHFLIIPKKHVQDLASVEDGDKSMLSEILVMAQTLSQEIPGAEDFKLITNNGRQAGQRVFHLHFHFLAGKIFSD
jgi:histidine triad (HIT) family protein